MTIRLAVARCGLRYVFIVLTALASGVGIAAANESGGLGASSGTPVATSTAIEGGVVSPPVTPEPSPTRDQSESESPPSTPVIEEATPDHDALAPGSVTVVLRTSDGKPMAARTMVCIEDMCQPADGLASGTKVTFDRVPAGWLGVTVRSGDLYERASSSVQVVQGQHSDLDLTLRLIRPVAGEKIDVTPPTSQPPSQRVPNSTNQGTDPSDPTMSDTSRLASDVTQLPATGTGIDSPPRHPLSWLLLPVVVGLSALFSGLSTLRSERRPR